jgi:hypothetical protein
LNPPTARILESTTQSKAQIADPVLQTNAFFISTPSPLDGDKMLTEEKRTAGIEFKNVEQAIGI